jgi:hypothetical protein
MGKRTELGQLDVAFSDGTSFAVSVYREEGHVFLSWSGRGEVPYEHLVRAENEADPMGWARELAGFLNRRVRSYDLTAHRPAIG